MRKFTKEKELQSVRSMIASLNRDFTSNFGLFTPTAQRQISERLRQLKEKEKQLTKEIYG